MDINQIPAGTRCLIDANIFIYHLGLKSKECSDFLSRIAQREIEGFVTTTIVAEVLHRQMLIEAVTKGLISPGKALKKLKDNPSIIQKLTDYSVQVDRLLQLPLKVIETSRLHIAQSYALRQSHGLFVNDSINLACALYLGITDVVSHDSDFARIQQIRVWELTHL